MFRTQISITAKVFKYNNGLATVAAQVHVAQPCNKCYIFWSYDTTSTVRRDFINVSLQLKRLFLIYPTFSFLVV